jgi:hypothetical protein
MRKMFSIEELSVLRQGLDLLSITGASARKMVALQDKVENALQKEIEKRDKELAEITNQ